MSKPSMILSFLLLAASLAGQAPFARIDVVAVSNPKVGMVFQDASDEVGVSQASWLGDAKDKRLISISPVGPEWRRSLFTFIPKETGKVQIELMGDYGNGSKVRPWIWYDSIEVAGARIANGSFENLNPKGLPVSWELMESPSLLSSGGQAQSGANCVKCTHDKRFIQSFDVGRGEPVTVSFWAKVASPLERDDAK